MDDLNVNTVDKMVAVLQLLESCFNERELATMMQTLCYRSVDVLGPDMARRFVEEQAAVYNKRAEAYKTQPVAIIPVDDLEH